MIPTQVVEVIQPGVPGPPGPLGAGFTVNEDGSITIVPTIPNFAIIDGLPYYFPNDELLDIPDGTQAILNPFDLTLSLIGGGS